MKAARNGGQSALPKAPERPTEREKSTPGKTRAMVFYSRWGERREGEGQGWEGSSSGHKVSPGKALLHSRGGAAELQGTPGNSLTGTFTISAVGHLWILSGKKSSPHES